MLYSIEFKEDEMASTLSIQDLRVNVQDKPVLKGVNLNISQGEVHALMGPNGTGKSTLAYALMGHPGYTVTGGKITFDGQDILGWTPEERARRGLFLAFQYPIAIPGVSVANFLRTAINSRRRAVDPLDKGIAIPEFRKLLKSKMEALQIPIEFGGRYLNDGFSGGEKKRVEVLQLSVLLPKIAIMDETDSGLDIDALRIVAGSVETLSGPDMGILVITHYQRILNYIKPQFVHVMYDGRIVEDGGADLAVKLEETGYEWVKEKYNGTEKS
jgi:Fe-S cluster assembly ATP-binding protein